MKQKIEFKYIAAPLVSIIAFLILLGGASYAYYSQSIGGVGNPSNISNANLTVTRGCTFVSNATNCVITANSGGTTNFTDSYISTAEMSYAYRGNSVAQSTCALNMGVQGQAGCRCTVLLKVAGSAYHFVNDSIKGQITSTNTSHSQSLQSINNLADFNTKLQVTTTGTAVYENMALTIKAFNVDADQATQADVNYVYKLQATPVCTVGADTYTVTFNPNGGSVSTTSKTVTVGEKYDTLPTPTWSGHTFRGWNGKNLINVNVPAGLPSNTAGDQATARTFTKNTYIIGMAFNNYYSPASVNSVTVGNDVIDFVASSGYGIGLPATVAANTTYTVQNTVMLMNGSGYWGGSIIFYQSNGTKISYSQFTSGTYTFTTPANTAFIILDYYGSSSSRVYVTDVQLEKGSVATAVEPFYVTKDTIVTTAANHTLTAIWD